jgi:hypothetical protein
MEIRKLIIKGFFEDGIVFHELKSVSIHYNNKEDSPFIKVKSGYFNDSFGEEVYQLKMSKYLLSVKSNTKYKGKNKEVLYINGIKSLTFNPDTLELSIQLLESQKPHILV